MTDKERFEFHNAPEKSPELFMEYLPYAIALGVEEKWAKVFEGILIPKPDWYSDGDFANFSALSFTKDIGVFSKTLAANSSNSGTEGSSGGGFSGGGGGRGGGGLESRSCRSSGASGRGHHYTVAPPTVDGVSGYI